jgi:hypothetical protein
MVGQMFRMLSLTLAMKLLIATPVEASSHVPETRDSLGHGVWLPLALILTLALLTAPAVLPQTRKRDRR